MKRVILIVLDSVGIGALPDADKYNDLGADTLGSIYKNINGFQLENLESMGLGNIIDVKNINKAANPIGAFGKMAEVSLGKDTTTGHWELAGIILDKAFPVYPDGFPDEIIGEFEDLTGKKVIGNCVASGTEIIKKYGQEHIDTKKLIVYTSADSVFQIAAHEEVIPVEELYDICKKARKLLRGKHEVGRVIARPFIGDKDNFVRTKNRKDFSLNPPKKTVLNYLVDNGLNVYAIGKIEDIFNGYGITKSSHTKGNEDGINQTIELIKEEFAGLLFVNLVDFDMLYGHRNDFEGYAKALRHFDSRVPEIINILGEQDILIITADHGCDPFYQGTDHTREYVPVLVYGKSIKKNIDLGIRDTFADVASTILEYFNIKADIKGTSFLNILNG